MLMALAIFMLTLPDGGQVTPDDRAGLFGSVLLVSYLTWLLTVAVDILRLSHGLSVSHTREAPADFSGELRQK
jgi:hypothetical protein